MDIGELEATNTTIILYRYLHWHEADLKLRGIKTYHMRIGDPAAEMSMS